MKIVFINISDVKGGASIVANRLRVYLTKRYNADNIYLVADKNLDDDKVYVTRRNTGELIEKITDRVLNLLGLQYQFFPFTSFFILRTIKAFKPDVISIHNTHGGYFETRLLRKISKIAPVVWTLHDMWSFTGNAAHTFGNDSWKNMKNDQRLTKIHPKIGLNTGSFLLRQKARIYKDSDLTIIVPCLWLMNLASQSAVFAGKKMIPIYNGVDLNVFKPKNKKEEREKLKIPTDSKVIMFSAAALIDNMWKGGDHLIEILEKINTSINYKLHLIIVGSGELDALSGLSNLVIHKVGYLTLEVAMANCLCACDLFIYPTKADTLPNILVEAIACGTPCVTFDIGGCNEIIINDFTGKIIEPFQLTTMAQSIVNLLNDDKGLQFMSTNARKHAEKYFSVELMAEKYYRIFKLSAHRFRNAQ